MPCREKHGVAVGWVILVGFFSLFIKRPRSVLEAREVAGRGGVQEGGSALLSSFVC